MVTTIENAIGERGVRSTHLVRRGDGRLVAIEVIEVERWHDSLVEPLEPDRADARLVRLARGRPPHDLPRWLLAELVGKRVTESTPACGDEPRAAEGPSNAALHMLAESVEVDAPVEWVVADFVGAGASAALHPSPVPVEHERRLAVVRRFCLDRAWPLGALPEVDGEALEWRLHRWFGDPDRFADTILLARLAEQQPELAEGIARLRRSTVPWGMPEHTELQLDRGALLEQLSPWRCLECTDAKTALAAALAALRAWQLRYDAALDTHRRQLDSEARAAAGLLEGARGEARALERLNRLGALGAADGAGALAVYSRATEEVTAVLTRGASVACLDDRPALRATAEAATSEVRHALEARRTRLAAAIARLVLEREGINGIDGLLQALQASEVDGLHRVLDDALLERLEALLGKGARRATLEGFLARYAVVRRDELDAAVEAFRATLEDALATSPDGTVALR